MGRSRATFVVGLATIVLSLLAIASAMARATIVARTLVMPVHERPALSGFDEWGLQFLLAAQRLPAESPEGESTRARHAELAARYVDTPVSTLMHLLPGSLLLLLAPLQFVAALRRRHPRVHRWSGRVLLGMLVLTVIPAFRFGVVEARIGVWERPTIALFGSLWLFAAGRAVIAIRSGDSALHREWMIRMLAMAIGIATVRLASIALALLVRAPIETLTIASMWIGWAITLVAAEWWIRWTREPAGGAALSEQITVPLAAR